MPGLKPLLIAAGALFLAAVGIGAYNVVQQSFIEARAAATSANLTSIGRKVAEFRATRGRFPRGASELDLKPDMLTDIISGRDFVWTQKTPDGTQHVPIVLQPAPYRTAPWPFGEFRQIALFDDGKIDNCLANGR